MNDRCLRILGNLSEEDKRIFSCAREDISGLVKLGYRNALAVEGLMWVLLDFPGGSQHLQDILFDIAKAYVDATEDKFSVRDRLNFAALQLKKYIAQLQTPQATTLPLKNPEPMRKPKETVEFREHILGEIQGLSSALS